ncbi:MAG: manganese efflux pump MntP family protein [Chloroflexota bacterium]
MAGLFLVSFSVGLGNFAASIGIGLSGVDLRMRLRIALVFGFFEALMPLMGLVLGQWLAEAIGNAGHYVGAALLILTGAYNIWQARTIHDEDAPLPSHGVRLRQLLIMGFALGIDNLVIGFALSLYHIPVIVAAVVIAVVSVSMSMLGLELGQRLGERFEKWSEEFGGAVLVLVGCVLALGLLQ